MEVFDKITALGEKKIGTEPCIKAKNHIKDYIKKKFDTGLISEEHFDVTATLNNKAVIIADGKEYSSHLYDNTGSEGNSLEGELYIAGYNLRRKERKKIKGKIVVFNHNTFVHRIVQIGLALKYKAAGVILVSKTEDHIQRGIGYPFIYGNCSLPAVGITNSDYQILKKNNIKKLRIEYSTSYTTVSGTNLVVDFPGEDKNAKDTIVIGAHYDSWYSGSQDNCIAVQLLIDILEDLYIHKKIPMQRKVKAIFFDGEETGLFGSTYHTDHTDQKDLDQYRLFLNLEMPIPTKKGIFNAIAYAGNNHVKKSISKFALLKNGFLPVPFDLFYKFAPMFPSDVEYFNQKGVPGISTFCSNPYVHTPLDNKENINFKKYDAIKEMLINIIKKVDEKGSRSKGRNVIRKRHNIIK